MSSSSSSSSNLLRVSYDEAGQRIDRYLKRVLPSVPHALVHKWLRSGQVRQNGGRVKAEARLAEGDIVRLPPKGVAERVAAREEAGMLVGMRVGIHQTEKRSGNKQPSASHLPSRVPSRMPSRMPLCIVQESEDFFLLDKPIGFSCQGGRGVTHSLDSALLALAEHRPSLGTPRLVHRLDRATSGVLLLAKSRIAAADLASLFRYGLVRKTYCAILEGAPEKDTAVYRTPLALKNKGEQAATTRLFVLARSTQRDEALVLLRPVSGRKHQLRRHMAEAGMPVLGDERYAATMPDGGLAEETAGEAENPETLLRKEKESKKLENKKLENKKQASKKEKRLMLHALRLVIGKDTLPPTQLQQSRTQQRQQGRTQQSRTQQERTRGRMENRTQGLSQIEARALAQVSRRYALDVHLPPPSDFLKACQSLQLDTTKLNDPSFDPFA